ncbi:MAG: MotA/TolQ/ExbB proton channel family protein [Verrucomicrobiota bacterium]
MFIEFYQDLIEFFDKGGSIVVAIFWVLLLMWILIIERIVYFVFQNQRVRQHYFELWQNRTDKISWKAHRIRDSYICTVRLRLKERINIIRTLIAICPLLGIMGTVTGMIVVFDVMTFTGTGNPRGMAAGITQATLPTMAGLVASLSGLLCVNYLESKSTRSIDRFADSLEVSVS